MINEIDPDNILPQKRNRVTSLEGIWSMISSNKIPGIFYTKNEEQCLKIIKKQNEINHEKKIVNSKNKKITIKLPKMPPNLKRVQKLRKITNKTKQLTNNSKFKNKTKNSKILKTSKKIRRNTNLKSKTIETLNEKSPENPNVPLSQINELDFSNPDRQKDLFHQQFDNKKTQKMKSIHIVDAKKTENYLRILQEHIGIFPSLPMSQTIVPHGVDFIKIED